MTPFNPYAAPEADTDLVPAPVGDDGGGVWRDDRVLVMRKTAELPPRCIVCNAVATGRPLRRRLTWHNPWLYLLILANIIVYALVAMIVQQKATISVGLCDRHRSRRRRWIAAAWLLALAAFVLPFLLATIAPQVAFGGFVAILPLVLVAGLFGIYGGRVVYPRRIDGTYVWLGGVGPAFLDTLPEWQGSGRTG